MSDLQTSENYSDVNPSEHLRQLRDKIALEKITIDQLKKEIARVIIGQQEMIDSLIIALLTEGHVLLEGFPGLAKTLAVKTLAQTINVDFNRIQFTPDLLPADVTGTMIYQQKTESFQFEKVLFLLPAYWQMRSIELLLRCKVLYLKRCRKNR